MKIFKTFWPYCLAGLLLLLSQENLWAQGFGYEAEVSEVSFSGSQYQEIQKDDGSGPYDAPHWTNSGTDNKPVSYRSGARPKVSAKFDMTACPPPPNLEVKIVGIGTVNEFTFPEVTVQLNSPNLFSFEYPATYANENFENDKVDFWDGNFVINWSVSFDGGITWQDAGMSEHTVYVTYGTPILTPHDPNNPLSYVTTPFHTILHLGCVNAQGKKDENTIVNKMYEEFLNRDVRRADGAGPMKYWGDYTSVVACFTPDCLLLNLVGRCGSWGGLFHDMIKVQGITGSHQTNITFNYELLSVADYNLMMSQVNSFFAIESSYVTPAVHNMNGIIGSPAQIYINDWDFQASEHFVVDEQDTNGNYPISLQNGNEIHYREETGKEAQGYDNPNSTFFNHNNVKYNGQYYDPSYGLPIQPTANSWEQVALAGIGGWVYYEQVVPGSPSVTYSITWMKEINNSGQQLIIVP